MDLDKLKETWKETDIKPKTDENKIYEILSRKGNTSLQKLINYEKFGMIICPFLFFLPFIHNYLLPHVQYPFYTIILFIGFCFIAFFWQLFKISVLKKIDISQLNLLSSARIITKYKKYLQYELIGGAFWIIIILGTYYSSLAYRFSADQLGLFILICSICIILAIAIIVLFYNFFYLRHVSKIQDAINEIKEFEDQED